MMKNKKLYHACMASILSAAMLLTSVPVSAAEFTSGDTAEEVAAALAEQGEPIPAEEAEDASQISAKAASDVVQINAASFADANFREYVSSTIDTDKSGGLSSQEISAVKTIDVSNKNVARLNGIERFTALTRLNASNNKIAGVDLSKNTKLTYVNLSRNNLTQINLSKCTNGLTTVMLNNNKLTKVTLPAAGRLGSLEYIDISSNQIASQANAGLANISSETLTDLTEINASNNRITSFNCSGFEGILDLSNNRITTFTGGTEGFQAAAIYLDGSGNTLSNTSKVNFSTLGNAVPQRFTCSSAAKSKIVMVTPKLSASINSARDQVKVSIGSSSDNATVKLERRVGSGAFQTIATWTAGQLDDQEFGDNSYTDSNIEPGKTYTYKLTASVSIQNKDKVPVTWSNSKTVSVKAVPAAPSITVKNAGKRAVTITWKAVPGASGYNVFMGRKKNNVTNCIAKYTTKTSVKRTGLQSGGTYYFRANAFVQVNGKRYPGPYSGIKTIKAK